MNPNMKHRFVVMGNNKVAKSLIFLFFDDVLKLCPRTDQPHEPITNFDLISRTC